MEENKALFANSKHSILNDGHGAECVWITHHKVPRYGTRHYGQVSEKPWYSVYLADVPPVTLYASNEAYVRGDLYNKVVRMHEALVDVTSGLIFQLLLDEDSEATAAATAWLNDAAPHLFEDLSKKKSPVRGNESNVVSIVDARARNEGGEEWTADQVLDFSKGKYKGVILIGIDEEGRVAFSNSANFDMSSQIVFALECVKLAVIKDSI